MPVSNITRVIILGYLSISPMTGYLIRKNAIQNLKVFWSGLSYGQIYPSLKALEEEQLIKKIHEKEDSSKIFYEITQKGKDQLSTFLGSKTKPDIIKSESLLKLFFSSEIQTETIIKNIEQYKIECVKNLQTLKEIENEIKSKIANDKGMRNRYLTLLYGIRSFETSINWTEESLKILYEESV